MAVGAAWKGIQIGTQVIKHAPKLQKLTKLNKLQKVLNSVKSTKNVIQSNLNTKQNLAKIGEKIGAIRNNVQQNNAIRNLNSNISKTVNTNRNLLKNTRVLANKKTFLAKSKELTTYLRNHPSLGGAKALPANASRFAKLRLGPLTTKLHIAQQAADTFYDGFRWDAPKEKHMGNMWSTIFEPMRMRTDNSTTNKIRNIASDVKHIGNRNKYKRTDLAGASMLKYDNTWWNPLDDNFRMVPNEAMKHNTAAAELRKLDAKYGNPKDKKK